MPCIHIIVCEGESEWTYLQRLQSFLDSLPLPLDTFETPLRFVARKQAVVKSGSFGKLKSCHKKERKENKKASIQIWADFDLYHRNDCSCAERYARKAAGIPDFLFSYHNFEDFFALHWDGQHIQQWLCFGNQGHFISPLHSKGYLPEIENIFPTYEKASLPAGFVSWASLKKLKANLHLQPSSNPHNLQGIRSFAEFLIAEIEKAYPRDLD